MKKSNKKLLQIDILPKYYYYIGKDCSRSSIWRTKFDIKYKATRKNTPNIGPFIQMAYDTLFNEGLNGNNIKILS